MADNVIGCANCHLIIHEIGEVDAKLYFSPAAILAQIETRPYRYSRHQSPTRYARTQLVPIYYLS